MNPHVRCLHELAAYSQGGFAHAEFHRIGRGRVDQAFEGGKTRLGRGFPMTAGRIARLALPSPDRALAIDQFFKTGAQSFQALGGNGLGDDEVALFE